MGHMNSTSYGPTKRHLWLMGKTPPKTWENCRETSERKSLTHSYDDLVDLLIELAIERENDSHMDKYLRKHLRRETPAEKAPEGSTPQPHPNPGKRRGGHRTHMTETPSSKGKGAPNLFYCGPTDHKGGPCHAPDCNEPSACMLQLKRTQRTKDCQDMKHQDHFRCRITCRYCRKQGAFRRGMPDKTPGIRKIKKAEEERRKNAGKGGKAEGGGGLTLGIIRVRVTPAEDEVPQPPPTGERGAPNPYT